MNFSHRTSAPGAARGGGSLAADRSARRTITSASDLQDALWDAAIARASIVESFATAEIVEVLAAAAEAWTKPHYPPRKRVFESLARTLDLEPAMLSEGLDALFGSITLEALNRMVEREAIDPRALDELRVGPSGRPGRLQGPPLVFHAVAGNVPGLALPHIAAALVARSICVVRDSRRQPLLTAAFLDTLSDLSTELARTVVLVDFRPGETTLEPFLFEQAARIEITGSDDTVRTLAQRHARPDVIGRGTPVSLGLIPAEADTDRWASDFVEDLVLYEGVGCLTPHVVVVEGGEERARRMAKALAVWLERRERLWPRRPRSLELERTRRAFIGSAEVSVACNPERLLIRGRGDAWCVHMNPAATLTPGPGMRTVTVVPTADRRATAALLRSAEAPLAAAGLALDRRNAAYAACANLLVRCGATWVCRPGRMHKPPVDWPQDGRKRLADLLAWRYAERR